MKAISYFRRFLSIAGSSVLAISHASGGTLYWDGGAADILTDGNGASTGGIGTWDTTLLNWDTGASPHIAWNNSNNDTAVFAGTAGTVTLGTGITVGGLTFNTTNYSITGGTLTLAGASAPVISAGTSITATISSNIAGTNGLEKTGAGILVLIGTNTYTGGTTVTAGRLHAASDAALGGSGDIILDGGTLAARSNGNTGSAGGGGINLTTARNFTVNSAGGSLVAQGNNFFTITGKLSGSGTLTLVDPGGGGGKSFNLNATNNDFTGRIILSGAVASSFNSLTDSSNNIVFNGASSFSYGAGAVGPLTFASGGSGRSIEINSASTVTATIQNNNTTHAITIGNDLIATGAGTKTLALDAVAGPTNTFGGDITDGTGGGTVAITKSGTGTWILSGANSYSGATSITTGILAFANKAAKSASSTVTAAAAGSVGLGVHSSDSAYYSASDVSDLFNTNTLTGYSLNAASGVAIDTTNAGGSFDQTVALTAARALTKLGTGTLILSQANSYSGATTVTAGVLNIRNNTAMGTAAGGVTVANGAALEIQGGITVGAEALTLNGTGISNGGALRNISGTNIYGGAITLGSATVIRVDADTLTLNGAIGGGTNSLTKEGTGLLTLNAANSYTGATTINGGTLSLGHATNTLADAGAVNINDGGTLSIGANSDSVGAVTIAKGGTISGTTGTLTPAGNALVSNNGGTITLGASSTGFVAASTVTYNDTIDGSTTLNIQRLSIGNLTLNVARGDDASGIDVNIDILRNSANAGRTIVKNGSGVVQLSGSIQSENFGLGDGATTINDGTLIFNKSAEVTATGFGLITIGDGIGSANSAVLQFRTSNNQIGNNAITINSDGRFDLNERSETSSGALTVNGGSITTGAGNLTLSGNAATILTLGGTASINGTTTFSGAAGAGITATGNASIAGTLAFGSNGRTMAVTNVSDTLTITANITGSGALTKTGVGTLQIGDGTTAGSMSSTSALTMGGGIFRILAPDSGGSSQTVASLATTASTNSIIRLTPGITGNTTLTITSATPTTGAGSSLNFDYSAGTTVGGTVVNNYVVWNPILTGGIIGGAYTVTDSGGTGFATTSGGNVVRLTDPGGAGLPVSTGSATGSYFIGSGYSTDSTSTPGSLVQALSGAVAASNVTVNTTGLASGANLALGTNLLTLGAGMVFDGPNAYEISGSGGGGLQAASAGGTINLYNANTSTVTISAPIVNNSASRLTVDGPGTTILSGTNTYTGATMLHAGSLTIGTTGVLGSGGGTAITVNGGTLTNNSTVAITGGITGTSSLTVARGAKAILANANNFSGTTNVTGTLQLGNAGSMGSSTMTLNSGATLELRNDADTTFTAPIATALTTGFTYNFDVNQVTGAGTNKKLSLGNITFATSSSGNITNTINVTGGNGYILGLGTISAPSGGGGPHPVVINATTAAVEITKFLAGSFGHVLQLQGGNSITLGNYEMNSNGNNSLTVSGSGTVVTLGTTSSPGRTTGSMSYTLSSGTLNLTTTTSLANVFTSGTATAPTFAINGGTLNNTSGSVLTLAANSGITAGSPAITIGGSFAFGTALSTSANNLNLGAGAVSITGNRTITLNGTGTTLTMGSMSNTSGANQTTTVNGAGNTLVLGGYSPGNGFTGVIDGNANVNITGAISSTGNFTYSGSAKMTLTGASTHSGVTTVNSGVLAIVNGGSLYSNRNNNLTNAVTVNSGGTVDFDSWTYASGAFGTLWHTAANTVVNGGTLRYVGMGSNTGNRSFTIGANGATLESAASGASWTINYSDIASLTSSLGGLLTLTGAGDGRIDLTIPGSGGLTKSGTGTWTITGTGSGSGSNTYSGNTNINQGVLNTTKALALPGYNTSGKVVVNGGTLGVRVGGSGWTTTEVNTLLTNATKTSGALGIDTTNGSLTQWTAFTTTNFGSTLGLTKLGTNTLTLDQTNTYTGATNVSNGTLIVNGSISNSSLTTVASGATIGGSGTVGALTVSSLGSINTGNGLATGILNTGNYSQAGLYTVDIGGLTAGTLHDQINVTGTVNITGGSLTAMFTGSYAVNDLIFILLNDGGDAIAGTYNGLAQGATFTGGGSTWQISYTADSLGGPFIGGGNDIALMAIPEPKTALLGCLGVLLLLRRRR